MVRPGARRLGQQDVDGGGRREAGGEGGARPVIVRPRSANGHGLVGRGDRSPAHWCGVTGRLEYLVYTDCRWGLSSAGERGGGVGAGRPSGKPAPMIQSRR